MKLFMCQLQLPEFNWEERIVLSTEEQPNHVAHWNVKEMDAKFSGEFGWKKLTSFTVTALQYMNRSRVRVLIHADSKETAAAVAKSFGWHLDAKKEHKRAYSRRAPAAKLVTAGCAIATKHLFAATG